jgi:hypothetical protein
VTDPGSQAHGGEPNRAGPAGPVLATLLGFRHPVVLILLLIGFFAAISGKPVDGVLMLAAGVCLAWDAGRRLRAGRTQAPVTPAPGRAGRRRWLVAGAGVAAAAGYAVLVGSLIPYSWPATIAIVGPGAAVVAIGWRGPVRERQDAGPLPWPGTALWGGLLVAGGLWELSALLQQPSLTTDSYAHPTISTLTDPVLAVSGGRAAILLAWLAAGWYLVRR